LYEADFLTPRAITDLSVGIKTCGPEAAVRPQSKGVLLTGGDGLPVRGSADLHGLWAAGGGAIGEVTEVVGDHAPEGASLSSCRRFSSSAVQMAV
jgi:hypothetical protein